MRKRVLILTVLGVLIALGLVALSSLKMLQVASYVFRPEYPFDRAKTPAMPDYSKPESWAALPDRADAADVVPSGIPDGDGQATARADVFYVHPSSLYRTSTWNQQIDDEKTNRITDLTIIGAQASVFNNCCKVYAPRYRQASLGTFLETERDTTEAFRVAYSDVSRAFAYYYTHFNDGRPFIIASHSQGSMHAARLLEEIESSSARSRLVAAYIPGYQFPMEKFRDVFHILHPCLTEGSLRCIASWDTYSQAAPSLPGGLHRQWYGDKLEPEGEKQALCTNPLNWRMQEVLADESLHLGAVAPAHAVRGLRLVPLLLRRVRPSPPPLPAPQPHGLRAQCHKGRLEISGVRLLGFDDFPAGEGNYHIYDYALFYMNIRQNVLVRVNAWLEKYAPSSAAERPPSSADAPDSPPLP